MGGGGAMKAAAKLAGVNAVSGGLRSITAEHYQFPRKPSLTRAAAAVSEDVKLVTSNSETGAQRPCTEIDDWVFTDGGEFGVNDAEWTPRVIFGGAPTLEEAKEATSELSIVLENAFLSSPQPVGADLDSSSSHSNNQAVETKACVAVAPAAVKAFRFLHESSAAKNVVASIACDQNVWDAVLQNSELQKFLQSQNACVATTKNYDDSSENAELESAPSFIQKIKSTVVDMMSKMSDYFQNLFGGFANRVLMNPDGSGRISNETFLEGSIMGLVVMAVIVILVKRA